MGAWEERGCTRGQYHYCLLMMQLFFNPVDKNVIMKFVVFLKVFFIACDHVGLCLSSPVELNDEGHMW